MIKANVNFIISWIFKNLCDFAVLKFTIKCQSIFRPHSPGKKRNGSQFLFPSEIPAEHISKDILEFILLGFFQQLINVEGDKACGLKPNRTLGRLFVKV